MSAEQTQKETFIKKLEAAAEEMRNSINELSDLRSDIKKAARTLERGIKAINLTIKDLKRREGALKEEIAIDKFHIDVLEVRINFYLSILTGLFEKYKERSAEIAEEKEREKALINEK